MEYLTSEQRRQAAREKREREEAECKALFPEQIKGVAAMLGLTPRFTFKDGSKAFYPYAVLEGEGRAIHVTNRDNDFRLHISGEYETGPSELSVSQHGIERPSITVGMRRPVEAIAKEIKSRFLPGYDAACALLAERVREATERRDSQRAITDRLARIAGVEVRKVHGTNQLQTEFFKYYGAEPYTLPKLEVKVSSGGDVTIEIDCGVELAAKIIAAMDAPLPVRAGKRSRL